ncbi:MAG: 50S ribosomal protein L13 [Oscillospiraceae bacterium]|jgi:large subunit ribosomal protein L13
MSTYLAKPADIERKWYIVDAAGKPLGHTAAAVADLLRGKNKTIYTPNVDCGDNVIVINCKDVVLTGKKAEKKFYIHHTGWIGHLKKISYGDLLESNPTKVMELAVSGMIPDNTLGRKALTRLHLYSGSEYDNKAQKPEPYEV